MWVGGRCRSLVFLVLLQGQHPPTRQSRILAGAVGLVFTDVSLRPGGGKGQGGGCKELFSIDQCCSGGSGILPFPPLLLRLEMVERS